MKSDAASFWAIRSLAVLFWGVCSCGDGSRDAPTDAPRARAAAPRVTGVVLHDGEPIEHAWVCIEPSESGRDPRWEPDAYTDAEGRFRAVVAQPGRYDITAWREWVGASALASVEVEANRANELVLELDQPSGTVTGHVRVPEGRVLGDVWLVTVNANRWMALREDGSFLLPDLPPGPLGVCVVDCSAYRESEPATTEWIEMSHGPYTAPSWLAAQVVWRVDVPPGGSATLDIDLSRAPPCVLEGRVLVDGEPPPLREREWERFRKFPRVTLERSGSAWFTSRSQLDAEGGFVAWAFEPGPYVLRIDVPTEDERGEITLEANVVLTAGTTRWQDDVGAP